MTDYCPHCSRRIDEYYTEEDREADRHLMKKFFDEHGTPAAWELLSKKFREEELKKPVSRATWWSDE